jgi:hypothetical protein
MNMGERKYRVTVYRYPFKGHPPYETELEAYNMLTDRVASADELIREKLLEDPQVSEVVKAVDTKQQIYEVSLLCVDIYLSEEEWKKIISKTIKAYKTRIKILQEYLKNLRKDG